MNQNKLKEWAEKQIELMDVVIDDMWRDQRATLFGGGYIKAMKDLLEEINKKEKV
jgi:hypothetical protein|tara:strand:+ start:661 stop:825 length:165 start_codon:yes stop_codon:yes gene_type:complete